MTSTPFVDGVTAALVGVHDVDIHLGFWRDELGYEVIDSGVINAATAKALYKVLWQWPRLLRHYQLLRNLIHHARNPNVYLHRELRLALLLPHRQMVR